MKVAAGVEGLAQAGGIRLSGIAYEVVKDKLNLGKQAVKNVTEPARVCRVLMEPEAAGKIIGEKKPGLKRWYWMTLSAAAVVVVAVLAVCYFALLPSYLSVEPAPVESMA